MERLTREQKAEVIEVLATAFHDYPVMRFVLNATGDVYESQLRSLVGFFCEARFAKNGHVLGIRENGMLIAIALVDEPIQERWLEREEQFERLRSEIGEEAFQRLELYENVTSKLEPEAPHYFIGMIGVLPTQVGKGHAGKLMNHAKELSTRDRRSFGVCLSTESPQNVPFYERFGYSIIGEVNIDTMHSWCMFLPTK
jgi:GNAT superfamily N-acetyltransferase